MIRATFITSIRSTAERARSCCCSLPAGAVAHSASRSGKRAPAGKSTAQTRARRLLLHAGRRPSRLRHHRLPLQLQQSRVGQRKEPKAKSRTCASICRPGWRSTRKPPNSAPKRQLDAVRMPGRQARSAKTKRPAPPELRSASRTHRDRTLPCLQHAAPARRAGALRRRSQQLDARTARHGGTRAAGQIYLEGGISWQHEAAKRAKTAASPSGDYHEFFKIQNIPQEPEIVESKLIFWGVPAAAHARRRRRPRS